MAIRKVRKRLDVRSDDDRVVRIREMLELYTMVPPSPLKIRKRKSKNSISEK